MSSEQHKNTGCDSSCRRLVMSKFSAILAMQGFCLPLERQTSRTPSRRRSPNPKRSSLNNKRLIIYKMCANKKTSSTHFIPSLLRFKCPRCRSGDMFQARNPYNLRTCLKMNDRCPVCHQLMEIEVGFWYGTSYISYAMTVALSVATCVAWWVLI